MPELQTRLKELARNGDPSRHFTVMMYPPPEDKMSASHRDYRYTLNGPPRQMNDDLIHMVIKAIRELSKDHMLFAASGIWPHNLDETTPIWPGNAGRARKLYAFTQRFEEFPLATEICVARGTVTLTTDHILVRKKWKGRTACAEPWTPLKSWLLQFPIPPQLTKGKDRRGIPRTILAQQLWWAKTGKSFRLMSLPLELRLVILRFILGENIYPCTYHNVDTHRIEVGLGYKGQRVPSQIEEPGLAARPDAPNYAVFRLNKSLRQEALRAGFQGNRKHFSSEFKLAPVIHASVTCTYNQLSRIYLHQTISEYFNLFGIYARPVFRRSAHVCDGSLLAEIAGLKHLELFFTSPYGAHREENPWTAYSRGMHPCQKTAIDYILTFAFPYIKDIPHVHLIGSVKSCTKFKWYYILGKEFEERKQDYRTHGYDHAAEIEALLGKSVLDLPDCNCPASCIKQPQGLSKFDHDDVYVEPPPADPLAVGGSSPYTTFVPALTAASPVQKGTLWSKVLMAPPKP